MKLINRLEVLEIMKKVKEQGCLENTFFIAISVNGKEVQYVADIDEPPFRLCEYVSLYSDKLQVLNKGLMTHLNELLCHNPKSYIEDNYDICNFLNYIDNNAVQYIKCSNEESKSIVALLNDGHYIFIIED